MNRKAAIGLPLAAAIAVAGGYAVVRVRDEVAPRGADGIALLPAGADLVASVDLVPTSVAQVATFQRIDAALDKQKWSGKEKELFTSILGADTPLGRDLAPLMRRSATMAMYALDKMDAKTGEGMQLVVMVPVSDPDAARKALNAGSQPGFYKGFQYRRVARMKDTALAIVGDRFVATSVPALLPRVVAVAEGKEPGFASDPAAKEALARVDGANVRMLVGPAMGKFQEQMQAEMSKGMPFAYSVPRMVGWTSVGMTIEDQGLAMTSEGRLDPGSSREWAKLLSLPPVRREAIAALPAGAYGAMTLGAPAGYYRAFAPEKDRPKWAKEFRKEMGMDLEKEFLPGFDGDVTMAAYPAKDGKGVDMLAVLDANNSANPVVTTRKLRAFVDRESSAELKGKPLFAAIEVDGQPGFGLTPDAQAEMDKSFNTDAAEFGPKTVAWVEVNGAVVGSSNRDLLARAVAARSGKGETLADDPTFAAIAPNGHQMWMAADPARIAAAVRRSVKTERMDPEGKRYFDRFLKMFEAMKTPLSSRAGWTPDGAMKSDATIPVDFAAVINLFGEMANEAPKGDPVRI